jgi:PIN domain nuclease of toxin-antitoxin system
MTAASPTGSCIAASSGTEAELSAHIMAKSSFLPEFANRDPADRIVVATAREHGHVIMTDDRKILDYARRGYVQAIAC